MTLRIVSHTLILIVAVLLSHCITFISGAALAPSCDGLLTDVFAVADEVSFQTAIPADGEQLLTQDEIDALADGFMLVYNQLQGDTCDNETIIVESVEGTQIVRLRHRRDRTLATAGVVTRIVSFRIKGNCRACGSKTLIGNDAPVRFLQQQSSGNSNSNSQSNSRVAKMNRGQFIKQYRLWIEKEKTLGRFQKSKVDAQSILKEGKIEIVGS